MPRWTLNRLFELRDQAKPRFAFQGTVNWMRALAIQIESAGFSDSELGQQYSGVQRRAINEEADTRVFENVLMALHNLASVKALHSYQGHN